MTEPTTKEKLMVAAIDLFAAKGYDATSVDEIAESLGIKGPNLYRFYKGKGALLEAIIEKFDAEYTERMGLSDDVPVPSDALALKQLTLRQIEYTIYDENMIKIRKIIVQEQYRNPTFSSLATKHQISNIEQMYAGIFSRMAEQGIIGKCDIAALTLSYISPISLMIQLSDREPEKRRYAMERIEAHIDFFIAAHFPTA